MNHKIGLQWLFFFILNCAVTDAVYAANPASKEYVDTQINRVNTQINQLTAQYRIGQRVLGGVIYFVYVDANGAQLGLVAATADEPGGAVYNWDSAQLQCANKNEGGYTDWIVPNNAQLSPLFTNRFAIDPNGVNGGFSLVVPPIPVPVPPYWSSVFLNNNTAWAQNFSFGNLQTNARTVMGHVRCIRTF